MFDFTTVMKGLTTIYDVVLNITFEQHIEPGFDSQGSQQLIKRRKIRKQVKQDY
jgi:hypothetical protein